MPQSVGAALQSQSQKKNKFEPQQLTLEILPAITMVGALNDGSQNGTVPAQNKELSEEKIKNLRGVLKMLGITAARAHFKPRGKLEKPITGRGRLSIMIGQASRDFWVLDHKSEMMTDQQGMDQPWKGITVFFHEVENSKADLSQYWNSSASSPRSPLPMQGQEPVKKPVIFETQDGLAEVYLTNDQRRLFKAGLKTWQRQEENFGVFLLQLRNNGKEPDPKCFDQAEKAEWRQGIRNAEIHILTPQEAKEILRIKVIPVPLRMVRTSTSTALSELLAKSWLVAPWHMNPQQGEFRTDTPTILSVAFNLTVAITASLG